MMKKILIGAIILILTTLCLANTEGYNGIVVMRDGNQIPFLWLGSLSGPQTYLINGNLYGAFVSYDFKDLGEIQFENIEGGICWEKADNFNFKAGVNRRGMIYAIKNGNTSILEKALVAYAPGEDSGRSVIRFVFRDAVTGKIMEGSARAGDQIRSIVIGEQRGSVKQNPSTKEFYPWSFNYDPYTGELLVLAKP